MKEYGSLRKKVNLYSLDGLMNELRCDSDMLRAVHTAMAEGPETADSYTNALLGVLLCLRQTIDKLSEEIYEVKEQ